MRKFLLLFMAFCLMAPVAVQADNSKTLNKELNKEYKKKVKAFKKEKWTVIGSRTLEVSLLKHYQVLNDMDNDAREIIGMSTNKTKNNSYQAAQNNAIINYATNAGSSLKGRAITDLFADGANPDAEFDHFFSAYERLVEKEIRGELQESFSLVRRTPEGLYETQVFYVVSEDKAAKARMRALENALKESEAAQKYADKLSDFVKEGFAQ